MSRLPPTSGSPALFLADLDVLEIGLQLALVDAGPISMPGSMPLPTFSFFVRSTRASMNWS